MEFPSLPKFPSILPASRFALQSRRKCRSQTVWNRTGENQRRYDQSSLERRPCEGPLVDRSILVERYCVSKNGVERRRSRRAIARRTAASRSLSPTDQEREGAEQDSEPRSVTSPGYVWRLTTWITRTSSSRTRPVISEYSDSNNGDSGANVTSSSSSSYRADYEAGATSTNVEHGSGAERPVGEPTTRPRDRG